MSRVSRRRADDRGSQLRVAVISSPRSGNSWVRHVLCCAFGLDDIAAHRPDALPDPLPARAIVQLHWEPTRELRHLLRRERMPVVAVARHPLDVLVSILHFARHEPQVDEWLGGGLVAGIAGSDPTSETFLEWAASDRARTLLHVTPAWWGRRATIRARYETLVANPRAGFGAVCTALGQSADDELDGAIARRPLSFFQQLPNRHGWQGSPGLWRRVIPARHARAIAAAHTDVFRALGYACDPDPDLDVAGARATWDVLVAP